MNGPKLRLVSSCHGCDHVKFTPSTASYRAFTECSHQDAPRSAVLTDTHTQDSTPQWCPMLKEALAEFTRGNPQHKVNQ